MSKQSDDQDDQAGTESTRRRIADRIPGPEATLQSILSDKKAWTDGAITPLLFLGINSFFGLIPAVTVAAVWGGTLLCYRIVRKQKLSHAVGGLLGMGIALLIVVRTGRATTYFLPNVALGALNGTIGMVSILVGRPMSAALFRLIEGKPKDWYRSPRVRTTHVMITVAWSVFLLGKSGFRYYLISIDSEQGLAITTIALGLPATAALAVGSWAFMKRRLGSEIAFADQTPAKTDS